MIPLGTLMVAVGRCAALKEGTSFSHASVVSSRPVRLGELMVLLVDVERLHLRRSVPVLMFDGVRWVDLRILAVA